MLKAMDLWLKCENMVQALLKQDTQTTRGLKKTVREKHTREDTINI